jgi:DNA-binding NarL/FixJ family response regulator
MRSTLKAFLAAAGIEVIGQLSNGSQLLQTITQSTPDIVCLDYNLPDINGIELLKSIASVHPQVAVVIITGEQDPNLRNAAAQAGAAGFIHKPFSQEQIVRKSSISLHPTTAYRYRQSAGRRRRNRRVYCQNRHHRGRQQNHAWIVDGDPLQPGYRRPG